MIGLKNMGVPSVIALCCDGYVWTTMIATKTRPGYMILVKAYRAIVPSKNWKCTSVKGMEVLMTKRPSFQSSLLSLSKTWSYEVLIYIMTPILTIIMLRLWKRWLHACAQISTCVVFLLGAFSFRVLRVVLRVVLVLIGGWRERKSARGLKYSGATMKERG